jgi:molybdenum cofactor cytidylyltransferase
MSSSSKRIGAVILAAGGSSRFGQSKQLIRFRGQSFVRRIIDAACKAGCSPVVVVIASDDEKLRRELDRAGVVMVPNQQWQRGIGSSIRCGIEALINGSPDVEATVLLVCDQPAVDARVIQRLIALRETTGKNIVVSSYADTLGVPVFRSCFHSVITQARNRLFCEAVSALRYCHSPKARLTSTLGKIGKSSKWLGSLKTTKGSN